MTLEEKEIMALSPEEQAVMAQCGLAGWRFTFRYNVPGQAYWMAAGPSVPTAFDWSLSKLLVRISDRADRTSASTEELNNVASSPKPPKHARP